jgi:hypothetical protein
MNGLKVMTKSNNIETTYFYKMPDPDISTTSDDGQILHLKIDKTERIYEASFEGCNDSQIGDLCAEILGKTVNEILNKDFYQLLSEKLNTLENTIWMKSYELLRAALYRYLGKAFLYESLDPVVCHCFGIKRSELLLNQETRAGKGCRSCLPYLAASDGTSQLSKENRRYFKNISFADWLLLADEKIKKFPMATDWGLNLSGMNSYSITIDYTKAVSQKEEEQMNILIQDFLRAEVDSDLSFFLSRA